MIFFNQICPDFNQIFFNQKWISGRKRNNHTCACVHGRYYIKLFRTVADRQNGVLMSLLLLVAETIINSWNSYFSGHFWNMLAIICHCFFSVHGCTFKDPIKMALQIAKNGMKARTTTYQGEKEWKRKRKKQIKEPWQL